MRRREEEKGRGVEKRIRKVVYKVVYEEEMGEKKKSSRVEKKS